MSDINTERKHGLTVVKKKTHTELLLEDSPFSEFLKDMVQFSKKSGASDIHIEPTELSVEIRVRIDGVMRSYKSVSLEHRESLILEVKRIFGLAIGVSGKPQDARVSFPDFKLDLRVNLLPTIYGEKIVMRLLNLDSQFDLESLNFLSHEIEALKKAIRFENGVIVISGATGSGKTKTLYSLLNEIGATQYNIVTLEDPVEYRLHGLNQVQVTKKMSFSDALRAVLRQDPDVILVGEVRDSETAKLCFQAAETGHLVLTTLHANSSLEVIERLYGLGVEKIAIESSLRCSIAQRLEERLCDHCKVLYGAGYTINDKGCTHCYNGIKGRVPVLEWTTVENKKLHVVQSLKESFEKRQLIGELDQKESFNE